MKNHVFLLMLFPLKLFYNKQPFAATRLLAHIMSTTRDQQSTKEVHKLSMPYRTGLNLNIAASKHLYMWLFEMPVFWCTHANQTLRSITPGPPPTHTHPKGLSTPQFCSWSIHVHKCNLLATLESFSQGHGVCDGAGKSMKEQDWGALL